MPEFNDRRPATPPEDRVTKGYAALWHGGSSYGPSYHEDHLEHFPTRAAAKDALQSRRKYGYSQRQPAQRLNLAHDDALTMGEVQHDYMPSVDETSYMDLHPIRKDGTHDRDVFHRLEFGKRGGVTGQWS